MSLHTGKFDSAGEARLGATELQSLLGRADLSPAERREALACFLAGGEGWREAARRAGGAFAPLRTRG